MTEIVTGEQMPPLVTDRSPELMRTAGAESGTVVRAWMLHPEEVSSLIAESEPGDGATCVVANFLRRQLPGCQPHIEGEHPYVDYEGRRVSVLLSRSAVEEIGRFDRGEPGAFAGGLWAGF